MLEQLRNTEKVRIAEIVPVAISIEPAQKTERTGRNPATGEEITIAAKPASVDSASPAAR